jgi:hypothetical protein
LRFDKNELRDLYLDGNDLRCDGTYDIIKAIADECENEYLKKEAQEREKREEEERRLEAGKFIYFFQKKFIFKNIFI